MHAYPKEKNLSTSCITSGGDIPFSAAQATTLSISGTTQRPFGTAFQTCLPSRDGNHSPYFIYMHETFSTKNSSGKFGHCRPPLTLLHHMELFQISGSFKQGSPPQKTTHCLCQGATDSQGISNGNAQMLLMVA